MLTSRTGCAPSDARSVSSARTFARYWAFEAVHNGVAQPPVRTTAFWYAVSAADSIVAGSAGAFGVPTLAFIFRSNAYVAAPRARASAA